MRFKIGTTEWVLPEKGPAALAYAKQFGLSNIQIDFHQPNDTHCLERNEVIEQYLKASQETGVTITAIAINVINQIGLSQELLLKAISAAQRLKVKLIFIPSFRNNEIKTAVDFNETVAFYRSACTIANRDQIILASENSLSISQNKRLIQAINQKNFKLIFDSYNPILFNHDPVKMIQPFWPYLANQIHLKDGTDHIAGNCPIGAGDANIQTILLHLKKQNFDGYLMLENRYDNQPKEALQNDIMFLEKHRQSCRNKA